jgi:hypothetical protein
MHSDELLWALVSSGGLLLSFAASHCLCYLLLPFCYPFSLSLTSGHPFPSLSPRLLPSVFLFLSFFFQSPLLHLPPLIFLFPPSSPTFLFLSSFSVCLFSLFLSRLLPVPSSLSRLVVFVLRSPSPPPLFPPSLLPSFPLFPSFSFPFPFFIFLPFPYHPHHHTSYQIPKYCLASPPRVWPEASRVGHA